jgi:hypothetical protein
MPNVRKCSPRAISPTYETGWKTPSREVNRYTLGGHRPSPDYRVGPTHNSLTRFGSLVNRPGNVDNSLPFLRPCRSTCSRPHFRNRARGGVCTWVDDPGRSSAADAAARLSIFVRISELCRFYVLIDPTRLSPRSLPAYRPRTRRSPDTSYSSVWKALLTDGGTALVRSVLSVPNATIARLLCLPDRRSPPGLGVRIAQAVKR